jgi:uncharacterized cupin superfamily protein
MRSHIILLSIAAGLSLAGPANAQDIGVPSCDKFIKTFQLCVASQAAPDQQKQMSGIMDQMVSNWKAVAATAEGKTALEGVCTSTAEQMKKQAAIKCAW